MFEGAANRDRPSGLLSPQSGFLKRLFIASGGCSKVSKLLRGWGGRRVWRGCVVTVSCLLPAGLGKNRRRWVCLSVEQPAIAWAMPDSVPLNINHLLKHLGSVPKAKGTPKRKERREGEKKRGKGGGRGELAVSTTCLSHKQQWASTLTQAGQLSRRCSHPRDPRPSRGDRRVDTPGRGESLHCLASSASPLSREASMGEMEDKIRDMKVSRVSVPRAVILKLHWSKSDLEALFKKQLLAQQDCVRGSGTGPRDSAWVQVSERIQIEAAPDHRGALPFQSKSLGLVLWALERVPQRVMEESGRNEWEQ